MPRVIHFEIPAENPERAAKFYADTFGWEIKKWEGPQPYWLVRTGPDTEPGINGGIYKQERKDQRVANSIRVEDIEIQLEKVKKNGGIVEGEIMDIPRVGRYAPARDTEGNTFTMLQPAPHAKMM
ncbi:MAG: VOC family protein [Candidatus Moranbacteria bacterium]|nr:VOC family protein [Candidatus Moranbacteria bacterium]